MVMIGLFNHWTDQFKVFSSFLAMSEVDFWCIHAWGGKHVENVTNHITSQLPPQHVADQNTQNRSHVSQYSFLYDK